MKASVITLTLALGIPHALTAQPVPVTVETFSRAESHLYFSRIVERVGLAAWDHTREPAPVDDQRVIRLNRDTIYSAAVLDLAAGPARVTLPEAGERFLSLQVIDEDQYTYGVFYEPETIELTEEAVGTRYVFLAARTFVDPGDPADVAEAQAVQDGLVIEQEGEGSFEIPDWDAEGRDVVRAALLDLARTIPDLRHTFGRRGAVDPVRFLIGSAQGWGGNPDEDAMYLNVVPEKNDGATVHRLTVGEVPVGGFWSVTVYNAQGYFEPNEMDAYALNNVTAQRDAEGTITIQFGGCDTGTVNCLPTPPDWNYMVRLYRPRPEILDGSWRFPEAEAME